MWRTACDLTTAFESFPPFFSFSFVGLFVCLFLFLTVVVISVFSSSICYLLGFKNTLLCLSCTCTCLKLLRSLY
uniref:Uncharacterized protein n=1 Tax=Anguilla anguilla TaxID=7936 RepID=A0A0E9X5A7_ANGAN